jgi:hypothetical protein
LHANMKSVSASPETETFVVDRWVAVAGPDYVGEELFMRFDRDPLSNSKVDKGNVVTVAPRGLGETTARWARRRRTEKAPMIVREWFMVAWARGSGNAAPPLRVGRLGRSSAPAPSREDSMFRTIFAVAISGLVLAAISGASQATPIAPLPAGVVSDAADANVTQVHWCGWRCRQLHRSHRWYYLHHPH